MRVPRDDQYLQNEGRGQDNMYWCFILRLVKATWCSYSRDANDHGML